MQLTELESDLLGDLVGDDHSLHEIFGFVRLHQPNAEDSEVLRIGRELVATWVSRGWLALAGNGAMWGATRSIADLVPLVDSLGVDATRYFVGSPWIQLSPKAYADVEWLSGAS